MKNYLINIIISAVVVLGTIGWIYTYKSISNSLYENISNEEKNIATFTLPIGTSTENLGGDKNVKLKPTKIIETTPKSTDSNFKTRCELAGGAWSDHYSGCLGVEYQLCGNIGGKFDACAANCSSTPDGEVCTNGCLRICRTE